MPSVSQNRKKIANNALARAKQNQGEQVIKAEFSTYSGRMIRKDQPKPTRPREMAAASSGGFRGLRKRSDGSVDYGDAQEVDQDGGGEITVSVADGAIVLEIAYLDDLVAVSIDPGSAVNLLASLSLALSEIQGE